MMKTEELLRYEAESRAMQEAFDTFRLVFDCPQPHFAVEIEDENLTQIVDIPNNNVRNDQVAPSP